MSWAQVFTLIFSVQFPPFGQAGFGHWCSERNEQGIPKLLPPSLIAETP
jgi:hypothetical protein